MEKVALVGFGDFALQILSLLKALYTPDVVVAFDDNAVKNGADKLPEGVDEVYSFAEYKEDRFKDYAFFVCLGYKHLKLKQNIISELLIKGYTLPSLVHPTSFVHKEAKIGNGCYVYPMCNIDKGVIIGNGTLLNNSVTVSHDTHIGECCYLSPGVILSGAIQLENNIFMGSGSMVSNGLSIGEGAIIGIGTVVQYNIEHGSQVIGNPLKVLNKSLRII